MVINHLRDDPPSRAIRYSGFFQGPLGVAPVGDFLDVAALLIFWKNDKIREFVAILGVYSQFWGFSNYIHLDLLCFFNDFNGVDPRGFVTMKKHQFGEYFWDLFPTTPQDPQANLRPNIHMGPGRHGSSFWSWWMCSFDVFFSWWLKCANYVALIYF